MGSRLQRVLWISAILSVSVAWMLFAQSARRSNAELWRYRNLGKAFYENPTTQAQAVTEFRKALDIAPDSVREIVNYGLALLRAGNTQAGIAELLKAQKLDPKLPHTWFNLGIAYKNQGDLDARPGAVSGHGPPGARRAGHPLPDGHDPQGAGRCAGRHEGVRNGARPRPAAGRAPFPALRPLPPGPAPRGRRRRAAHLSAVEEIAGRRRRPGGHGLELVRRNL